MKLALRLCATALAALSVTLPALANSVIVDASGGSGSFTDIQPAIDASQPGDVLLVLAGSYLPFTLEIRRTNSTPIVVR